MVEVFKTNVLLQSQADMLIQKLCRNFPEYEINFDLDDCDKILRVKSLNGIIYPDRVIQLLARQGFAAEVLSDLPVQY